MENVIMYLKTKQKIDKHKWHEHEGNKAMSWFSERSGSSGNKFWTDEELLDAQPEENESSCKNMWILCKEPQYKKIVLRACRINTCSGKLLGFCKV